MHVIITCNKWYCTWDVKVPTLGFSGVNNMNLGFSPMCGGFEYLKKFKKIHGFDKKFDKNIQAERTGFIG